MDAWTQMQVSTALGAQPAFRGLGIVHLSDQGDRILQKPASGGGEAAYVVLMDSNSLSSGPVHPADVRLLWRLRLLGVGTLNLIPVDQSRDGFALFLAASSNSRQGQMQTENLTFTSVSNILKTRHDTAKNSISNVR